MEIEDKAASRKIYIADSKHNLLGLDFIKSIGLLDILLHSVCNAVLKSPAQGAITEQINDTKCFSPIFTNYLRCCTQTEGTPTLKPSATPIFQPKRPEQPWSLIHVDFAGPLNGFSFLVVVYPYSKLTEIFWMQKAPQQSFLNNYSANMACQKH